MVWLIRATVCWAGLAAGVVAQDSTIQYVAQRSVEQQAAADIDLQFRLHPVVLDAGKELQAAQQPYQSGNWQQVLDVLRPFVTAHPKDPQVPAARLLMGEALVQLRQYPAAVQQFQTLLQSGPNLSQTAQARFRIAEAQLLNKQPRLAYDLLQQFHRDFPQHDLNAFALNYLAELASEQGDSQAALAYTKKQLQQFPAAPQADQARLRLGLLHYQRGEQSAAGESLFRAVEAGQREQESFWVALYWLAMTEYEQGKFKSAVQRWQELLEAQPDHKLAEPSTYFSGQALREVGAAEQAAGRFQTLRKRWPNGKYSADALMAEMQLAYQGGRTLDAVRLLAEVEQHAPSYTRTATLMAAELLLGAKRYQHALELIQPLVQNRPSLVSEHDRREHQMTLLFYGLALRGSGNRTQAAKILQRIRIHELPARLAERVLLVRAETANASRDYAQAVRAALTHRDQYPDGKLTPLVRVQLMRGLVFTQRFAEAQQLLTQMRQGETPKREQARAARVLAEEAFAAKRLQVAQQAFDTLLAVSPKSDDLARAQSGLAWIAMRSDEHEEARRRFGQFLHQHPDHVAAGPARLALAQLWQQAGHPAKAAELLEYYFDQPHDTPHRAAALFQLCHTLHESDSQLAHADDAAGKLIESYRDFAKLPDALYLQAQIRAKLDRDETRPLMILARYYPQSSYWPDAVYRLAELARADGQLQRSQQMLASLLQTPDQPRVTPHALYLLGRVQSELGQWEQARQSLRRLLREYPDSSLGSIARYGIAESFYQQRDDLHAEKLFDILYADLPLAGDDGSQSTESILRDGAANDAWPPMVMLRLAQLAAERKQWNRVEVLAQRLRRDYPEFALLSQADYLLGRMHSQQERHDMARTFYQRVIEADPGFAAETTAIAQCMLGESYFIEEKYVLAIKSYEAVPSEQFPLWRAAARLQIGKCYELLGDRQQAQNAYERVLTRYSNTRYAQEATQRMSLLKQSL